MNTKVTVVIPCKDEGETIINTLNFILKQTEKFKIIIADSSTQESSKTLLEEYQKENSNQIKIVEGGLPSIARNNGVRLVETEYVLFLDADVFIKQKDLIVRCLDRMIIGGYDLLTCKFKTEDNKFGWVYKIFNIIQWFSSKTKPFCLGGFMFFRTKTFRKLGGFNEEDKIAEDYHISSKIKPKKFKVSDLYVYTLSRRFEKKGVWYMIKLMFKCWWNRNNEEFFKKDYNYWK